MGERERLHSLILGQGGNTATTQASHCHIVIHILIHHRYLRIDQKVILPNAVAMINFHNDVFISKRICKKFNGQCESASCTQLEMMIDDFKEIVTIAASPLSGGIASLPKPWQRCSILPVFLPSIILF